MTITIPTGYSVYQAIQYAIDEAKRVEHDIQFSYGDIMITASPFSHDVDLAEIWSLKRRLAWRERKPEQS